MGVIPWFATGLLFAGLVVRMRSARTYVDLHAKRYSSAPPWTWMWTPVADPEVERWRRVAAAGSLLAIAGAVLLMINAFL